MATARPKLKVAERGDFGSRTSRRLRREGLVPGVVYTSGEPARPFQADARELSHFLGEGHTLFDLEIEGAKAVPVVVKEQQRHPVRGELVHIDCHEVDLSQEIQADVSLDLEGAEDAAGVKEGGVLEHVTREITVEALPEAIPESLSVDVTAMEIGDTMQLTALTLPEGVELVADHPEEITIATLNPPPVVEEPETEIEEETELVGAEGEEGEGEGEAAEGDGEAESGSGEEGDGGDEG
jgi:large subunit ribosomal protein L25